jgi:hypothetical protein
MEKTSSFLTGFFAMLVAAGLFSSAGPAQAALIVGFQGPYDPVNWTLTTNGGDGSVDTSGAPGSITLVGSDTGTGNPILTDYTTLAVGDGLVSFSWDFTSADDAFWDRFGYLFDGTFTQLTDNVGGQSQSGSASFGVLAGQTFGFRVVAVDDGNGRPQSTISSFEAPSGSAAVPEPGTWAAAALLAGGAAFMRWRKRAKVA